MNLGPYTYILKWVQSIIPQLNSFQGSFVIKDTVFVGGFCNCKNFHLNILSDIRISCLQDYEKNQKKNRSLRPHGRSVN